ncbi:ExbD/TolR family protein [Sandarakinorhabdus sp.]|uniref:ExbD/TolR family protein n=1 Tax=Sandarakinorhabdus sp. TaxID=1916663 RepID=UPI00333EA641
MAMNLKSPAGGRRGSRRQPMADINVTPLVDVMLVLLIIFMVTAPLLVAGVPVDLPDARAQALPQDQTPIQISLDGSGQMFIDRLAVAPAALPAKLAALRAARSDDARVYVRADRMLDYGAVMQVVGEVNAAGFRKVALVTDGSKPARLPPEADTPVQ